MSVIFSSFYHQCPIACYVCSVSESLGASADSEFRPSPASFCLADFYFVHVF